MNFIRRHVRGGSGIDIIFVALLAVGQRGRSPKWCVLRARIRCAINAAKGLVRGNDVIVDGIGDLLGQACLRVRRKCPTGNFFVGRRNGSASMIPWHCTGSFSTRKRTGMSLSFMPARKNLGGLAEDARDLVKARDVVFVMLDRVEGNGERQVGEAGVDAVLLVDGHLVLFEIEVGDALLEDANEQVVRELVLIGESAGGNGVEAREKAFIRFVVLHDAVERVVVELVVIAVISEGRGALREIAEFGLVLFIEKGILRGNAVPGGFRVLAGN